MVIEKNFSKRYVDILIISIFLLIKVVGMISGHWENKINLEEYFYHIQRIESSEYPHPTGSKSFRNTNN